MIDVGKLRKRVTIVKFTRAPADGYGQQPLTPVVVGTFWAEIRPLSGRELVNAAQIKAEVTHAVEMRYQSTPILPDMQIQYNGRNFNIESVLDAEERHRRLDILAQEIVVPNPS